MKKMKGLTLATAGILLFLTAGCGKEKTITVIVREASSGTREAFDKTVGDGVHTLQERVNGKIVYNTTKKAIVQTKTGAVLAGIETDANAIGYISLNAVNEKTKVISVNGFMPSEENVVSGAYQIQRPFVIMTNGKVVFTPLAADFINYLYSDEMKTHAQTAGCIFIEEESRRANEGQASIPVTKFERRATIPAGNRKIVVRGSTSMEKLIFAAAKGYASEYGVATDKIGDYFDIQLEGSSKGKDAVEEDETGNVIGLSSAAVVDDEIFSFNVCLDAVAVVVHRNNPIDDLSVNQLYDIFSGKVTKFSEITR